MYCILHVKGVGVWVGVGVVIRAIVDLKICWSEEGVQCWMGGHHKQTKRISNIYLVLRGTHTHTYEKRVSRERERDGVRRRAL